MLVLSRFRNETIVIGSGDQIVEVTVVDIKGEKVRLGINAPAHVPVHRKEVYEAIKRAKLKVDDPTKSLAKEKNLKPVDALGITRAESDALFPPKKVG